MGRWLLVLLLVSSCAPSNQQLTTMIKDRASFDLACPKDKLNLTILKEPSSWGWSKYQNGTVGAEGCNLRRTYIVDEENNIYAEGVIPTK